MTPVAQPKDLTVAQAAAAWGVHLMTMYKWTRTGRVPAYRVGGRWRINRDELERHFRARARGIA